MPLLRGRRDEASMTKYRMQEKLSRSVTTSGSRTRRASRRSSGARKALRVRDTLVLETPNGEELLSIQAKVLHVRDTMTIERGGRKVATVKKALVSPLRDRFSIDVDGGDDMEAKGNIVDHEYRSSATETR